MAESEESPATPEAAARPRARRRRRLLTVLSTIGVLLLAAVAVAYVYRVSLPRRHAAEVARQAAVIERVHREIQDAVVERRQRLHKEADDQLDAIRLNFAQRIANASDETTKRQLKAEAVKALDKVKAAARLRDPEFDYLENCLHRRRCWRCDCYRDPICGL